MSSVRERERESGEGAETAMNKGGQDMDEGR